MTNRTTADAAPPAASDGGRVVTPRHDAGRPVPPRAEPPVGAMTPAVEVAQLVGVRIGVNPCGRPCTHLSAPLRRRSRVPEVEVARA